MISSRFLVPAILSWAFFCLSVLVESSLDLAQQYGDTFAGTAKFVTVSSGPNAPGKVRLYRLAHPDQPGGPLQGGGYIEVGSGNHAMPKAKRERRERTDHYHLIQQWCRTPEQHLYEGIRPVVLFGLTTEERAAETSLAEHTLRRVSDAFDRQGGLEPLSSHQRGTRGSSPLAAGHDAPAHRRSEDGVS